jgi:FkbM family methyltransferase
MHLLRSISHGVSRIRGAGRVFRSFNRALLASGFAPVRVARMQDGTRIRVDLRSQTEWYSFYSGTYDEATIGLIGRLLGEMEGGFLDVGGNIGMYAVRVAAVLQENKRVICFEPVPENASRIRDNANLNGLGNLVSVNELALSDRKGTVELVLREDFVMGSHTGNASIAISEEADGAFRKIVVCTEKFDDIRKRGAFGSLPVAKVDIEGHEDFFLAGAQDYIKDDRPIIISEINNWFYNIRGTTSSRAFLRVIPSDYRVVLLKERGANCDAKEVSFDNLCEIKGVETCAFAPDEKYDLLINCLARRPAAGT